MTTDDDNVPPPRPPQRGMGPMGQPPDTGFGCVWVLIIAIIVIILIWIFGWGWRRGPEEPGQPGGPTPPGPAESENLRPDSSNRGLALSFEGGDDRRVIARAHLAEHDA